MYYRNPRTGTVVKSFAAAPEDWERITEAEYNAYEAQQVGNPIAYVIEDGKPREIDLSKPLAPFDLANTDQWLRFQLAIRVSVLPDVAEHILGSVEQLRKRLATAESELTAWHEYSGDCPYCHGGGVEIIGFNNDPDVYENIESDCPHCKGTGTHAVTVSPDDCALETDHSTRTGDA